MLPREGGTELESVFLRSRRRFRSDKKRKTMFERGSCSTEQEEEGYEFASYLDEGSYDKEEEYEPISEGDKESEESNEAPKHERVHNSPTVPEVRSRNLSPSIYVNSSSTNTVNSRKGSLTSPSFSKN